MHPIEPNRARALFAISLATFTLLTLSLTSHAAGAAEIVPAIGLTKAVDGDGDTKVFGSLAIRGDLLPVLQSEVQVAYRTEERFDDQLKLRMWPITASLYLKPVPVVYIGAGVGWYQVTYDFDDDLLPPIEDETESEFGIHVGGGLKVPLAPSAAIDVSGRYVMMRDQEARLVPEKFDPDFWTTSVGIAFRF